MKREKMLKSLLSVLCVLSLTACGKGADLPGKSAPAEAAPPNSSSAGAAPAANASQTPEPQIQGSVVSFSDGFCVITPMQTGEDGRLAYEAAPGHEDSETNITIHYQEGCTVQIAEIDVASGKRDLLDAEIADIKKQTSLIVYGEWVDEHNLNATALYIARYRQ